MDVGPTVALQGHSLSSDTTCDKSVYHRWGQQVTSSLSPLGEKLRHCSCVRCDPGSWGSAGSPVRFKGPTEPQLCSMQMLEHKDLHRSTLEAVGSLQCSATRRYHFVISDWEFLYVPSSRISKNQPVSHENMFCTEVYNLACA